MNLLKLGATYDLCTKIFLKKQGGIPPGGAEPICSAEDISICSLIITKPHRAIGGVYIYSIANMTNTRYNMAIKRCGVNL